MTKEIPSGSSILSKSMNLPSISEKAKKLDEKTYKTLKLAAIVHDIGIHKAEKKYGQCGGKLQEKEGPPEAENF